MRASHGASLMSIKIISIQYIECTPYTATYKKISGTASYLGVTSSLGVERKHCQTYLPYGCSDQYRLCNISLTLDIFINSKYMNKVWTVYKLLFTRLLLKQLFDVCFKSIHCTFIRETAKPEFEKSHFVANTMVRWRVRNLECLWWLG